MKQEGEKKIKWDIQQKSEIIQEEIQFLEWYIGISAPNSTYRLNETSVITIQEAKQPRVSHGTLDTITRFNRLSESEHTEPTKLNILG